MAVLQKQQGVGATATDAQIGKIVPAAWQGLQHIDPTTIRPMAGRVIVKDIHDDEHDGRFESLVLPQNVQKAERKRLGEIVAVGEGDRWITMKERGPYGAFRHKGIKCEVCDGLGKTVFDVVNYGRLPATKDNIDPRPNMPVSKCHACHGSGLSRLPMETKPGDRVIYDKRRECALELAGESFQLCYEEQAILCVLEND